MLLNYVHNLRSLNRNVLLYLAATCLIGFALDGGVFAVLFNLYLLRLGFGPEFIGQVIASGMITYSITALISGSVGERFGYRVMMVIGLILMSGGGFFLPLAEFLPRNWQQITIISLFSLLYIGMGFYYVNCVPYVTSISSEAEHSRAFSMQTAILALAAFTGSLFGGFLPAIFAGWFGLDLDHAAPYRYPLILASLALLPGVYILLLSHRVPKAEYSETVVATAA